MNQDDSLESALIQFTDLVLSFSPNLTSHTASSDLSLLSAVIPFAAIVTQNVIVGASLWALAKVTLRLVGLVCTFALLLHFVLRTVLQRMLKRSDSPDPKKVESTTEGKQRSSTRIIEDDETFERWERIARDGSWWSVTSNMRSDLHEALHLLGVSPTASEIEVRRAYRSLMKQHHPDLFMHASTGELERLQSKTVRIRDAYEVVTKSICRAG